MVETCPAVDPKGIYKAGRTAKLLGIGTSTLWRWTYEKGRITPVHRPGSAEDLYRGRDIINLWKIVY